MMMMGNLERNSYYDVTSYSVYENSKKPTSHCVSSVLWFESDYSLSQETRMKNKCTQFSAFLSCLSKRHVTQVKIIYWHCEKSEFITNGQLFFNLAQENRITFFLQNCLETRK